MKEDIFQIIEKYLKIFPGENSRQAGLIKFLEQNKECDIKDWNNFKGHIVAGGFVYAKKEKKFLALYHKDLKMFLYPGGHIDNNDKSILETAIREVTEETGFYNLKQINFCNNKLVPLDIDTHLVTYNDRLKLPEHFHYEFRYLFEIDEIKEPIIDKEELERFKWIDIEEFKKDKNFGIIANKIEKIDL